MVKLPNSILSAKSIARKTAKKQLSNFVDEAQIYVKGGDGGDGCISFRREAHIPRGGPDGGDGGDGGDVWIKCDSSVSSLIQLKHNPHQRAKNGMRGMGKNKHGVHGQDYNVLVPIGTEIYNQEAEKLADLVNVGDSYLASAGGVGGKGSARFLSNRRRAPGFAELGELSAEDTLRLELKLLADIALIGFPNAGKSTLISRISAAKPKIADYPFTTLEPNLGAVIVDDIDFTVADIPGLIKGASTGKGLGHQFLRHIERALVLVILLDLSAPQSCEEQLETLLVEVGQYNPELLERPRILVGSKADIASDANKEHPEFLDESISSVVGTGIPELKRLMAQKLNTQRSHPQDEEPVIHRPQGEQSINVEKVDKNYWRLSGRTVERAVALYELSNPEAMLCVRERLDKLGVDKILSKAGAIDGDTVSIGTLEFEYFQDSKIRLK